MNPVPSGYPGALEQSVSFRRNTDGGEMTLYGTLCLPENIPGSETGVITLHGWGGTRCGPHRIFVRLGRKLAARGVPTLRFDFSGRGESDGDPAKMTLDDMIADALAAREFLLGETGVKAVRFCGMCSGGNVALGAQTLLPETVGNKVALVSTLPFSKRNVEMRRNKTLFYLKHYARKAFTLNTWKRLFGGEINLSGVAQTLAQKETAAVFALKDSKRDIMADFAQARPDCLFVYGEKDPEAHAAREHYRTFCKENEIPFLCHNVLQANHNFYSHSWSEEVEAKIAAYLLAQG
jgi:pimeloyl-ACP methyl ester carboxylesterase